MVFIVDMINIIMYTGKHYMVKKFLKIVIIILLFSCHKNDNFEVKNSETEHVIDETENNNESLNISEDHSDSKMEFEKLFYTYFSIILPTDALIELYRGPDFRIFYLDTHEKAIGGIYLGNYPSSIISNGYRYNINFASTLFEKAIDYQIYYNGNVYITEMITKNSSDSNWPTSIHLWLVDTSIEGIKQKITLFSTLKWNL